MHNRKITISLILLFMLGIIYLIFFYGPGKRAYLSTPKVELFSTTEAISTLWERSGLRGRTAILFTRHLNAEESPLDESNIKYADLAMKHGIVRTIYHVLPDAVWDMVSVNLSRRENVRATSNGFVMIKSEGRIHILSLSHFEKLEEKSLVVLEPGVWGQQEEDKIISLLKSGDIKTDLLAIIRGGVTDRDLFYSVLTERSK